MTREELIENGYEEQLCKIGYLYFKGGFFCSLDKEKGIVDYRHYSNDLKSLGKASTFDEIKQIEKKFYQDKVDKLKTEIKMYELVIKSYDNEDN